MGFVKARGSSLYYQERGEGPPILLIPPSAADLRATMGSYPSARALARITAPVVCTYGSRSRGYMRAVTRSLARVIPSATAGEIDGAAHAVAFDAPGNFAHVIAEAMRSSEVRSGT